MTLPLQVLQAVRCSEKFATTLPAAPRKEGRLTDGNSRCSVSVGSSVRSCRYMACEAALAEALGAAVEVDLESAAGTVCVNSHG